MKTPNRSESPLSATPCSPFWLWDHRPRAVKLSSFCYGMMTGFGLGGIPALLICGKPILAIFAVIAAIVGKWVHAQIPLANVKVHTPLPARASSETEVKP